MIRMRLLNGTISCMQEKTISCMPPPRPNKTPLAIDWLMELDVAPTMPPTVEMAPPTMRNHRRPKISANRPLTVTTTAATRFQLQWVLATESDLQERLEERARVSKTHATEIQI